MITKEFVALTLFIAFIISLVICILYSHYIIKKDFKETKAVDDFESSEIDDSDIQIICK